VPIPFEEWVQAYPLRQQETLRKALNELNIGNYNERLVNSRGEFVKVEPLMKSSPQGVESLTPRAIQSGTAIHNAATGPTMKAFSKRLAAAWNVKSDAPGPKYTSGATSEDIGACFARAVSSLVGRLAILEGDFARFDSTIHRRLLEIEARVMKYAGASPLAIHAMLAGIKTRGRDKWRNRYEVDGGRHSGDHNTSCGNTLLQGLAILFCLSFYSSDCVDTISTLCENHSLTLLLLGDDNLIIGDEAILRDVPLTQLLLKLGLQLEPKLHLGPEAQYRASFCSARFWPTKCGKTVLASGPGRMLSKAGYAVNVPANLAPECLARADALGRSRDNAFVPFSGPYWKRVIELTKDVQAKGSAKTERDLVHATHTTAAYEACDESFKMTELLYGLTKKHEDEYKLLLNRVPSLPASLNYAPLHRAMVVDGVSDGEDLGDGLPVEETCSMQDVVFSECLNAAFKHVSHTSTPCLWCNCFMGDCKHTSDTSMMTDDHSSVESVGLGHSDPFLPAMMSPTPPDSSKAVEWHADPGLSTMWM
jgi:hypothetical protein